MVLSELFEDAMLEFRGKPYAWPAVSCVGMIEMLSAGMANKPDYRRWKPMLETTCMLEISKMPGTNAENYVACHEECLGPDWIDVAGDKQAGDILFVDKAWGVFTTPHAEVAGEFDTQHWYSPEGWPATIFPGPDGKLWAFSPEHGLKIIHNYGRIIKHKRRRDAE